jgi:hypothetical protein
MRFVVVFSLMFLSWAGSAYAHLVVDGTTDDLTIEVNGEPLSEVLMALGKKLGVRVKSSLSLDVHRTGRFAGSLKKVMKDLLEGYDFVVLTRQEGSNSFTEVIVLGRSKSGPSVAPISAKHQNGSQKFDGFK